MQKRHGNRLPNIYLNVLSTFTIVAPMFFYIRFYNRNFSDGRMTEIIGLMKLAIMSKIWIQPRPLLSTVY